MVGISSYSPLDAVACPAKPFGDFSSEEYLEFARDDLSQDGPSALVNSLGNAKRCFHYQTEKLLYRFCLREASATLSFPNKVELLRELRIVSGNLLTSFNRDRNVMEHGYATPSREMVEGAIDLCELYLPATERFLIEVPGRMRVVMSNDGRDLILALYPGNRQIEKSLVRGSTPEKCEHGIFYEERIFESLFDDKINKSLVVERLYNEDIPLRLDNKDNWLQILRMFTSIARPILRP